MKETKTIYSNSVVDICKCDFPHCNFEAPLCNTIDNPFWRAFDGKDLCKFHYNIGKIYFLNRNSDKLFCLHKFENTNGMIGEIIEILPQGYYKVQWFFDDKKIYEPISYHASVLKILPFPI